MCKNHHVYLFGAEPIARPECQTSYIQLKFLILSSSLNLLFKWLLCYYLIHEFICILFICLTLIQPPFESIFTKQAIGCLGAMGTCRILIKWDKVFFKCLKNGLDPFP